MEAAGADFLVLCTNTMHKVADEIQAAIRIPLLNIIDVAAGALQDAGVARPALLATGYTMEQPFYRDRLARHGLGLLVPETEDRRRQRAGGPGMPGPPARPDAQML